MVFPSFTGQARRGGWPKALLPFSTPKSKLPRKPRKRSFLGEFLFANFFTVGVSITTFFFVFLLICYGVPKPISSHFRTPISRLPKPRKLPNRKLVPSYGAVDITTKDLYDRIEFLDVDGGPWKQGWRVNYKGHEWDSEKLKVFVVPHSHNDPGWRLTVEEYYEKQSRHILDTIVETLSKDSRRRFIWEEMSYLERWWRDAPNSMKKGFSKLVRRGQLEIVGGGWVMNDEANSHYFAILEQITEGNLWLNDTIGVVPKNSWSIDPFGYSPTMAYLFRRMGFENMLIQRTHYELKKELALHKNLEFIWRQSWDAEESTDIFVHMMPFYSYDIPHTCGPEPAICCQFDFARMPEFSYERCPWGQHPQETTKENLQERALVLLDQYRKKSTLYRTNTLLVPLGDDFRYVGIDEAEAQFRNYQQLFDYINSSPNLNADVQFGTLEDYFRCLREEAGRIDYSVPGQIGSGQIRGFPSLSGDFFTYADRQHDYWSGYYVSRPFFKAVDRVLEHTLRAADMMVSLLLAHCQRPLCEKLPMTFAHKLTAARRNLALFQHHDGVTGTAKDHVVVDYGNRMHTSLDDLQVFMSKAIEVFLGIRRDKSDHSPSQFEPALVRSEYDVQPVHKSVSFHEKAAHTVVFFNPIEQTREEVVMVVADWPDVVVLDANWTCVKSQVSPEVLHNSSKHFSGKHRVYWRASIPALGLQTYYIANGFIGCEVSKRAELKFYTNSTHLRCPASYTCTNIPGDLMMIQNRHLLLTFDPQYGLLSNVTTSKGSQMVIHEEIGMYSSHDSGAYLFKPDGDADLIIQPGGHFIIIDGPLVHEAYSYPKTEWMQAPISHVTRLYDGEDTLQEFIIEKEYHIELLGRDFVNKELIVRYKTDIDNRRIFYSDLNGLQTSRRETYDKIPLQGNYYPMPSMAFMHGIDGRRFSVHSRQALGVASLKNGWLEIMLDRRLARDDGRGLGQGVMDNRPLNVVFNILIETNTSTAPDILTESCPLRPSLDSHRVGTHLNYPLHVFISRKAQELSSSRSMKLLAPLASSLPCDLHIVSFKVPHILAYSERTSDEPRFVLTLNRQDWDNSYGQTGRSGCASLADIPVNLFYMFKGLAASNVKSTSLNLLHDDVDMLGYVEQFGDAAQEGHVLISPMEIQAYKLELQPHVA